MDRKINRWVEIESYNIQIRMTTSKRGGAYRIRDLKIVVKHKMTSVSDWLIKSSYKNQ